MNEAKRSPADDEPAVDFENELNPSQRAAVLSVDGPHLVVAGAGSGKTRTLVYRVANLVRRGVPPESILLLTFTRRAAREMLRRAAALLDARCERVAGGTFHSFANVVLRRYARLLGYQSSFTILDRADCYDMVGVLRAELGLDRQKRRFPRRETLVDLYSKKINTGRSLADLLEDQYPAFVDDRDAIEELERRFVARKKEQNVMDYDDLLVNLRDLLVEHERVREKLSSTYRYIMLDEYQDTNRLQAHIAALLASAHGNLMVVGDDAQSIYSFRGASFRNIIDFPEVFPDCKTILLEQNYRSTQPILELGNAIMERARERYTKELFTSLDGGEKPVFVRTGDEHDQARFVCQRVLELREEGIPLGEIAVLVRAAWHSNTLEIELKRHNIPFKKFGGIRFAEAAHVKDVSAFLKVGLNPGDAAAWFRVLQLFEGIGPRTAQRIGQALVESRGAFGELGRTDLENRRYGRRLRALDEVLGELRQERISVAGRLERAIEFYRDLMPKKYDDVERRLRDLEAVQLVAGRYKTLESFLSDLAIEPPEFGREGGEDREEEWMTVSTVHSAKGLEWHTVFILGLNSGQFPTYYGGSDDESYEEERRLFYVGVTRAKRGLLLLKPERVYKRGLGEVYAELTPLVSEIDGFETLVECQTFAPPPEADPWTEEEAIGSTNPRFDRIQGYFGGKDS